jgi:predicted Fe-S protein YdhL (DUF1289 family)
MKSAFWMLIVEALWILSPLQAADTGTTGVDDATKAQRIAKAREHWKTLTPEQRKEFTARFREYQKMSPEEKQRIHKNYQRWKSMPAETRQQMQNLHQRLQKLPLEERKRMEENLKRWQGMKPEEREKVRQKLRERNPSRPSRLDGSSSREDGPSKGGRTDPAQPKD